MEINASKSSKMDNHDYKLEDTSFLACYDLPEQLDRYTIVDLNQFSARNGLYGAFSASKDPFYPTGIGQHTEVEIGEHLGKEVNFNDLPAAVRKAVIQNFLPDLVPASKALLLDEIAKHTDNIFNMIEENSLSLYMPLEIDGKPCYSGVEVFVTTPALYGDEDIEEFVNDFNKGDAELLLNIVALSREEDGDTLHASNREDAPETIVALTVEDIGELTTDMAYSTDIGLK
jgi:hypothetical protein